MGYSVRIPLWRGTVKIKSESRLRTRELNKEVPMFRLLSAYVIWEPRKLPQSGQEGQPKG
jgi:hypothetical protein